tara:strand:+ start:328 stop:645 length:318 start_codon:yes stop_codon:yes gene_type:complete
MAQILKLPKIGNGASGVSEVINADQIVGVYAKSTTNVYLISPSSYYNASPGSDAMVVAIEVSNNGAAQAVIDINKALTSNPGGRVVELPPSSEYSITAVEVKDGQ